MPHVLSLGRRLALVGVLLLGALGVAAALVWRSAARPGPTAPPAPPVPPGPTAPTPPPAEAAARARAIERALAWLTTAQEPEGSWDLVRWNPHHGRTGLYGFSEEDHWFAAAATGLVALAFLESAPVGASPPPAVVRALDALVRWQRADGRIGFDEQTVDTWFREKLHVAGLSDAGGPGYKARTIHTFNHAVGAAALATAARATHEARWLEAARRALAHLVADEHREYHWTDYYDPESDVGVAAYVVLAARAGRDAGLVEAQPLLDTAPDFLDRITDAEAGRTRMQSDHPACFEGDDSTAINAYCRRLLGQAPDAAPLRALLASVARSEPSWTAVTLPEPSGPDLFEQHLGAVVNHDAWTYGVRALEGVPGARGKAWRETVRRLLLGTQVAEGEHSGSWDPIGVWDRVGGRIYATAMAVRSLAGP